MEIGYLEFNYCYFIVTLQTAISAGFRRTHFLKLNPLGFLGLVGFGHYWFFFQIFLFEEAVGKLVNYYLLLFGECCCRRSFQPGDCVIISLV